MRHRQLPQELQERVRRFVQYKWLTTRGVDEEAILRALPLDLRRQIQRHLCLALVRRVRPPHFDLLPSQVINPNSTFFCFVLLSGAILCTDGRPAHRRNMRAFSSIVEH